MAFKIMECSDAGCPDIFFTCNMTGGGIFLEVKAPGEKPKQHQEAFMNKLKACCTRAYWVDTWDKWVVLRKSLGLL